MAEFCNVCVDFLENGLKKGMVSRAAQSMGISAEILANALMALADVLVDAAKVCLYINIIF